MDTHDETHPKDRIPPKEGVVHPADELDRVNDRGPTDDATAADHDRERPLPPRRPTDGPM